VAVHDLVVQEREKDLVLGTHGRSFYLADISLLQQLKANDSRLLLAKLDPVRRSSRWGRSFNSWSEPFEPNVDLQLFAPDSGKAEWSLNLEDGTSLQEWETTLQKGVNMNHFDLSLQEKAVKKLNKKSDKQIKQADNGKYYLPEGTYFLKLKQGPQSEKVKLEIK
jgi:hypothetical protein